MKLILFYFSILSVAFLIVSALPPFPPEPPMENTAPLASVSAPDSSLPSLQSPPAPTIPQSPAPLTEQESPAVGQVKSSIDALKKIKEQLTGILTDANAKIEQMHTEIDQATKLHQEILQAPTKADADAKATQIAATAAKVEALIKEFETSNATINTKLLELEAEKNKATLALVDVSKVSLREQLKEELAQSGVDKQESQEIKQPAQPDQAKHKKIERQKTVTSSETLPDKVEHEWRKQAFVMFDYFLNMLEYLWTKAVEVYQIAAQKVGTLIENYKKAPSSQDSSKK